VRSHILRSAADEGFAMDAYCFMPDHVHLLVEGTSDGSDCLRFIKRAKQFSGFHFMRAFERRLWQRYGYEHVIREQESPLGVARYILENPVRAGLVARVEEYPHLGSATYSVAQILDAVQLKPATAKSR